MKKQEQEQEQNLINPIQQYIMDNCENINKMDKQLTYEQAEQLSKQFNQKIIENKIMAMENCKGLQKKYISVYLTLLNWCKNN